MKRQSPDLLVTTPESLYLLLTAPSSRALLRGVRTVIVDEVHTLARDKRGSHLALSLERLDALVTESGGQLQRIGLSATQRPLDLVARLLVGRARRAPADRDRRLRPRPRPRGGHRAALDRARGRHERRPDVRHPRPHRRAHAAPPHHPHLRQHAQDGRAGGPSAGRAPGRRRAGPAGTTSTRRCSSPRTTAACRRPAGASSRRGCAPATCARSWPPPRSSWASTSARSSWSARSARPRAIGTFLQRVGRANHHRDGTPAGRLYPTTRDELVECTALLAAVREGRLDLLEPPVAPLDVLAQQLVAEVAVDRRARRRGAVGA